MDGISRRAFVLAGGALVEARAWAEEGDEGNPRSGQAPMAISSANGLAAVRLAVERMRAAADPLVAAVAGVTLVEDDPNDQTVGLGGLPNEEGVVELDASVMHGPSARAGAVASLKGIRNPSHVARLVLERTDHVLLVGEGARKFALAHGFVEENLLTDSSRREWLMWKESLSDEDDWLSDKEARPLEPAKTAPDPGQPMARTSRRERPTGTIHLGALDAKGDLGAVTSTSGLAFKIPGRVGDSPILGAGIYVDNEVGCAGSTGRGEANLLNCSSILIVEAMRRGRTPEQACLDACQRIVDKNLEPRLRDKEGRPNFDVKFYALDKKGRFGSASLFQGNQFAFADANSARLYDCAYLFKKPG